MMFHIIHKSIRLRVFSRCIVRNFGKNGSQSNKGNFLIWSAQWSYVRQPPWHMPKPNLYPTETLLVVLLFLPKPRWNGLRLATKYCTGLQEMSDKLLRKQPKLVNSHRVTLLYDNTIPHVSGTTVQKSILNYETLPLPPYSLDLLLTDYHFFKHQDHFVAENIFNDGTTVKNGFEEFIASRNPDFHQNSINGFVFRREQCIEAVSDYFKF